MFISGAVEVEYDPEDGITAFSIGLPKTSKSTAWFTIDDPAVIEHINAVLGTYASVVYEAEQEDRKTESKVTSRDMDLLYGDK